MTESVAAEQMAAMTQESAGAQLMRAREAQGMSVADVASALRLGVRQVEAIEADDYDKLPGRTFARGFMRNYARLVNLDPEPLLAACLPVQQEAETQHIQVPSQHISFSEHHRKPWLKWLAAGFVVVALLSWGVMMWLGPESARPVVTVKPVAPAASGSTAQMPALAAGASAPEAAELSAQKAQPAPLPVEKTAPMAAQARVLLSFSGPAWVEVRDKHGKKLHSQNNPAGTQQTVEGEPPLSLVIGSAPNVKLTYKGQPVDLTAYTRADVARLTLE
ncbi:MAG: helix-turn-helix domain-containing protein [Sulfurimicrobium sp.]